MYFDSLSEISKIAERTGCAIFVVPDKEKIEIKNAFILQPEEKTVITIEQVRKMIDALGTKQMAPRFVLALWRRSSRQYMKREDGFEATGCCVPVRLCQDSAIHWFCCCMALENAERTIASSWSMSLPGLSRRMHGPNTPVSCLCRNALRGNSG